MSTLDVPGLAGARAAALVGGPAVVPAARTGEPLVAVQPVGTAAPGEVAARLRAHLEQSGRTGETFTAYGFLLALAGLGAADLFTGAQGTAASALLTVAASGRLVARPDGAGRVLDVEGELNVHQRTAPGADLADPASFQAGRPVARFTLVLLDVTGVARGGSERVCGELEQTYSGRLAAPLSGRRFGVRGQRLLLDASASVLHVDLVTLDSIVEIEGALTADSAT